MNRLTIRLAFDETTIYKFNNNNKKKKSSYFVPETSLKIYEIKRYLIFFLNIYPNK